MYQPWCYQNAHGMFAIDLVHAKAWSGKNQKKVVTASNFMIVYEKSEGKSIERSIELGYARGITL